MYVAPEMTTVPRRSVSAPPSLPSEISPAIAGVRTPTLASSHAMRAVLHRQYGGPELLSVAEVAKPTPGEGQVLVRVCAAGVSIGDHHIITGKPYVIRPAIGGLFAPGHLVPGATFAGRIEALGANVDTLAIGDEVVGQAPHGAYAEYVVVAAGLLAPKPS